MVWIQFIAWSVFGYIGIAIFNKAAGFEATSLFKAWHNAIQPIPFLIMILANLALAGAVYYGFLASSSAIPIMLSLGILTTFSYSVVWLGVSVTPAKILGLVLLVAGIYLLR